MELTTLFRQRTALVIPRPGGACFALLTDRGPTPFRFLSCPEEDPRTLLCLAAEQGFSAARLSLAVLFPSLRVETLRCPDMSEADLAETMHWERDRLFRTDAALAMDWTVLSHGPTGWDTAAAACSEETLTRWAEGAEHEGVRLAWAAAPFPAEGECVLLLGHTSALALSLSNGRLEKRRLAPKDMPAFTEGLDASLSCHPVPLSDCTDEDWAAWSPLLPAPLSLEDALAAHFTRLASKPRLNLAPAAHRDQPFLRSPLMKLRAAQCAFLLSAAALLAAGVSWSMADGRLAAEEGRHAALASPRRAMAEAARLRGEIEAAGAERRAFVASDLHWEMRLLTLAEALPASVTVTDISAAGSRIRLAGTASESAAVADFQKRLAAAWNLPCRIDSLRTDGRLHHYVLLAAPAEGGAP